MKLYIVVHSFESTQRVVHSSKKSCIVALNFPKRVYWEGWIWGWKINFEAQHSKKKMIDYIKAYIKQCVIENYNHSNHVELDKDKILKEVRNKFPTGDIFVVEYDLEDNFSIPIC